MQFLIDIILEAARNVPRGRIRQNTLQTIATGTWVKLKLDTLDYENKLTADPLIATITITEAGYYLLCSSAALLALAPNKRVATSIYLNGTRATLTRINTSVSGSNPVTPTQNILFLQPADFLELYIWHDHGSWRFSGPGSDATFLAVHLLS